MKLSGLYKNNDARRTNLGGFFFCAACFLIFPLIIHNYTDTTVLKIQTFIVLLILSAVLCVASALINKAYPSKDIIKSPTLWFVLTYLVICIISVMFSPYKNYINASGQPSALYGTGRTDGLLYIFMYLLALIIPAMFCGLKKSFAYLLAVSGGANAIITILQLFGLNVFGFIPGAPLKYIFIEFSGTIGNIDFLSAFLCFCACLISGYYIITDDGKQRQFLLVAFALIIYAEFAIGVNSGLIGLLTAAIATFPLFASCCNKLQRLADLLIALFAGVLPLTVISHTYNSSSRTTTNSYKFGSGFFIVLALLIIAVAVRVLLISIKPKYKRKPALIALYTAEAIIIILAVIIIKIAFSNSDGLLGELSAVLNGNISPMAGSHRVAIWQFSLKMFSQRPIFGVGTGEFCKAFSDTVLREYQQVIGKNTLPDAAHNEFIQQLVTVGIVGFAAYMGWLLSILIRGFKYALKNPKLMVCLCTAIGFAAQMSFNINILIIAPFFYVILGITEHEILSIKQSAYKIIPDKQQTSAAVIDTDIIV